METRRLYFDDPRTTEFEANLVACEKAKEGWEIELDRSAFYPEGGGQPADRGWIDGVPVLDVAERNGSVRHIVAFRPAAAPGATVKGQVDWERRFDYMQQHTGQHLISAAFLGHLGVETVSVHLGESYTTVELNTPALSEADIAAVEERANAIIGENRPVRSHFVPREEIAHYRLRKTPPDLPLVRLVEIVGFDLCACGGTHVASTGELGLVHAVGSEAIRGHVRVQWKIGRRAYRAYREADALTEALARELGGKPADSLERVRDLLGALKDTRAQVVRLERRLVELTAATLPVERVPAAGGSPFQFVGGLLVGESEAFIRELSQELVLQPRRVVCLVNDAGDRLRLSVALGPDCGFSPAVLVAPLLPLVEGRGGGRDGRWQGNGARREGASAFIEGVRKALHSVPGA